MPDHRLHLALLFVLTSTVACTAVPLSGGTTAWHAASSEPRVPLRAPSDQEPQPNATPADGRWQWRVVPYVWAADMDGNVTVKGNKVDIDVPFSETFDHLDSAGQMIIEARKDDWAVVLDNTYMVISADAKLPAGTPIPAGTPVDLKTRMWLAGLVGLHRIEAGSPYEIGFGMRYAEVSNELDVGSTGARGNSDVLDGVLAGRATWPLDERWALALYGDAGTGDSDFTWQTAATCYYRFDGFALGVGYRVLDYDFGGSDDGDLTFSGFTMGADFRF